MNSINFFTPVYYETPSNLKESLSNFAEFFLDFGSREVLVINSKGGYSKQDVNSSCLKTALKVAFAVLTAFVMVGVAFVIKISLRLCVNETGSISTLLLRAPKFNGYRIGTNTPFEGPLLLSSIRPANLFFDALFGPDSVHLPGSDQLFGFKKDPTEIKDHIRSTDGETVVAFSAEGKKGQMRGRSVDLTTLYGNNTYRMSYAEIQTTLDSQKIYVSSILPLPFYQAFKKALKKDKMVSFPGRRDTPVLLRDLHKHGCTNCDALIKDAENNHAKYGFKSKQDVLDLLTLTVYQMGCLVVKTEDFRIFIDGKGKIIERQPGENDAIKLINACGVRGFYGISSPRITNKTLIEHMFHGALTAAGNGVLICPAIGMGVWGGDPDIYWRAFLDSVVEHGDNIGTIYVNPRHQKTPSVGSVYAGSNGKEFEGILQGYIRDNASNPKALANLKKIVNLYEEETDVVQLAYILKKEHPDQTVSLINASDPDVTLGYHVGQQVNKISTVSTTEENYTALGTNGICFEDITGVHEDPTRVVSVD